MHVTHARKIISKTGPLWSLLVLFVVLSISSRLFFTGANLMNVLRQVAINLILASGMAFVIISGGIDLSVGSVVAFCGAVSAAVLFSTQSVLLSYIICLVLGSSIGFIQGVLIAKGNAAPFAITLGGLSIFRGLTLVFTNGIPISGFPKDFRFLGTGYFLKIPAPIILEILVIVVAWILLNKTRIGRYSYAIGSNQTAAKLTGIAVDRFKIYAYVISGFCAALASLVLLGRINSAHPQAGSGYELIAIAAVVIGGTSLNGGEGTIVGTVIGALIIGLIQNGLNLLGVNAFWQEVVVGMVIVVAVLIDNIRTKVSSE